MSHAPIGERNKAQTVALLRLRFCLICAAVFHVAGADDRRLGVGHLEDDRLFFVLFHGNASFCTIVPRRSENMQIPIYRANARN